mmetsp:Transcript_25428/g.70848  ORF Transcript_25428/g.70848 Transcript_25428/m.70848 type:complete len:314 (-) Transcript_25428:949-1890(-)
MACSSSLRFCNVASSRPGLLRGVTFTSMRRKRFRRLAGFSTSSVCRLRSSSPSSPRSGAAPSPSLAAPSLMAWGASATSSPFTSSMVSSSMASSSTSWAPSMVKVPCKVSIARTLTLRGSGCDGSSTLYTPSSFAAPSGNAESLAYIALISKGSFLQKVTTFRTLVREFSGKMMADRSALGAISPPPSGAGGGAAGAKWLAQLRLTGKAAMSSATNSRHLIKGDKIAACKVQPRATHSSAFMVVESSLPPNAAEHISFNQGTRHAPPHISTVSTSDAMGPAVAFAASSTPLTLFIMGSHISKKSERSMLLEKS